MKMLFSRFYIENYHANYNWYVPLKIKSITGIFFVFMYRDGLWKIVFLIKVMLSQNPSPMVNLKLMSKSVFLKSLFIVDTFMIYSLVTLTTFILDLFQSVCICYKYIGNFTTLKEKNFLLSKI